MIGTDWNTIWAGVTAIATLVLAVGAVSAILFGRSEILRERQRAESEALDRVSTLLVDRGDKRERVLKIRATGANAFGNVKVEWYRQLGSSREMRSPDDPVRTLQLIPIIHPGGPGAALAYPKGVEFDTHDVHVTVREGGRTFVSRNGRRFDIVTPSPKHRWWTRLRFWRRRESELF